MVQPVFDSDYRSQLPGNLYSAEQTRELDRYAIKELGISGLLLMERAGLACFKQISNHWPCARNMTVLCGHGNNGGDGYVIAALAKLAGMDVTVLQVGSLEKVSGDAATCLQRARSLGVFIERILSVDDLVSKHDCLFGSDLLIDALLGTGVSGAPRGLYADVIQAINQSPVEVFSVDCPSGLCVDTGWVEGVAVKAQITMTFIGVKQGLLTGQAANHTGILLFDDLLLPEQAFLQEEAISYCLDLDELLKALPQRPQISHKGDCGHVLIIGGAEGMSGAAVMAANAAARVGAGLVSVASPNQNFAAQMIHQPEIMCPEAHDSEEIQVQIERANVLVIGPGLGRSEWSLNALRLALKSDKPCVVDADALNLFSASSDLSAHNLCVFTPHPKEASRLLKLTVNEVQKDRFKSVREIASAFDVTALLKGSGTLICNGKEITSLVGAGGPAMASGGMGDVLSGVIGGLMAQGCKPLYSAQLGAMLHAMAGDRLAETRGVRGNLASDLLPIIRQLMAGFPLAERPENITTTHLLDRV